MTETEAIRARYSRRSESPLDLCIHEERNRAIDDWLAGQPSCAWSTPESDNLDPAKPQRSALPGCYSKAGTSLNRKTARVLDVGCGNGGVLYHLLGIGFESQNLTGIDLLPERILAARRILPPEIRLICGDATDIGFESQDSDLVLAFTLFSSVLDSSYRKILAERLWAASKPGGGILVYDFCVNNPFNKDVRAVTLNELRSLFPKAQMRTRRLTLAPPLARRIGPRLYKALSQLPFLQTHLLSWLEKPAP